MNTTLRFSFCILLLYISWQTCWAVWRLFVVFCRHAKWQHLKLPWSGAWNPMGGPNWGPLRWGITLMSMNFFASPALPGPQRNFEDLWSPPCLSLCFIIKHGSSAQNMKRTKKYCAAAPAGDREERWTGRSDTLIQQAVVQQAECQRHLRGGKK